MAYVRSEGAVIAAHSPPYANRHSFALNYAQPVTLKTATYGYIYEHQPNVRSAVSFLGRNMGQLGMKAYKRNANDDREKLDASTELAQLLDKPNGDTTQYRFIEALVSDIAIFDVAYVVKVRGKVTGKLQLLRIPPHLVELEGDNWLTPDEFVVKGDRAELRFKRDEVIYIHGYSPVTNMFGTSPMESLRDLLVSEYNATQYRNQMWKNGARINGIIERPAPSNARDKWDSKSFERFSRQWKAMYTGEGPEAGGTPVLEDGMKFNPVGLSPQSAQYIETRKLTELEVCKAWHIPPTMLGILDFATFGNIEEQHKMLYMDTLGPWAALIEQELKMQLIAEFYPDGSVYIEFNIREKLQGSFVDQADATSKAVGSPWMTPNEARKMNNLPATEGGDDLVTPLNVTVNNNDGQTPAPEKPSNDPAANPVATDEVPPKDTAKLDAFFARQKQVLASKAGAGKFTFDQDRWKQELLDAMKEDNP